MNDSEQKIRELQSKLDEVKRDFDRYKSETKSKMDRLERVLANHQHAGNDGSNFIYNDTTHVKPQQQFQTGRAAFAEIPTGSATRSVAAIGTGEDSDAGDGIDNAQITLDYDTSDKTTIVSALGGKIFQARCKVTSGSAEIIVDRKIPFPVAGYQIVIINDRSDSDSIGGTIISNTDRVITMSNNVDFSSGDAYLQIFTPVYLGFTSAPWRRLYLLEGSEGGIRFGYGSTEDGNNSLLFVDTDGRCKFRRNNGEVDII